MSTERGRIEGIGGGGDDDGEAPGVQAWNRYMRHAEELDGAEAQRRAKETAAGEEAGAAEAAAAEQARIRGIGRSAQDQPRAERSGGLSGAAAAAAGAAARVLKNTFVETPEQRRMDVLAAMQAEALARLEIPMHADQVGAAQRASDGQDPAQLMAGKELAEGRRVEREEVDMELPAARKPGSTRPAQDWIAPAKKTVKKEPEGRAERDARKHDGRRG